MAYQVRLEQFEGPLDLLLHLIEQAELDIKDIFVSEITAQYLAYMSEIDTLDMDTASEFLTMAATLVYIKSRQLLPRPPQDEEEAEDPETVLLRQLREYKAFKEAGAQLQMLFDTARSSFTRLPEDVLLPPKSVALDGADMDGLFSAFSALLARSVPDETAPRIANHVRPDAYTVRRQMGRIREALTEAKRIRFESLFAPGASKMEMVVTFMALLEMLAHGEIHIKQSTPFAPILIDAVQLGDDETYQYLDEEDQ